MSAARVRQELREGDLAVHGRDLALADQDDVWDPDKLRRAPRCSRPSRGGGWSARTPRSSTGTSTRSGTDGGVAGLRECRPGVGVPREGAGGAGQDQLRDRRHHGFRASFVPDIVPIPRAGSTTDGSPSCSPCARRSRSSTGPSCGSPARGEPGGSPEEVRGGDLLSGAVPPPSSALRTGGGEVARRPRTGGSRSNRQPGAIFGGWRPRSSTCAPRPAPGPRWRDCPGSSESSSSGNYHRYSAGSGSAVKDLLRT